jgi:hypothetical protein
MLPPVPEDRPPPNPPLNPSVLEYERPTTNASYRQPALSAMAVAALATALAAAGVSLLLGRQVLGYRPASRLELCAPLIALIGVGLSVNALLRIGDRKNNLWGDPMAWTALLLNTVCLLGSGCCLSLRWVGALL